MGGIMLPGSSLPCQTSPCLPILPQVVWFPMSSRPALCSDMGGFLTGCYFSENVGLHHWTPGFPYRGPGQITETLSSHDQAQQLILLPKVISGPPQSRERHARTNDGDVGGLPSPPCRVHSLQVCSQTGILVNCQAGRNQA